MKKDIFIDTNIVSKFSNPQDKEYVKLSQWLLNFKKYAPTEIDNNAYLVVSKKLLVEYYRSAKNAFSDTSIPMIINQMQSQGRLIIVGNQEIKDFKSVYFTKTVEKKLKCNFEDREHIPLVFLSERKFALSYDNNFINDIKNFPGFNAIIEKKPEKLPYSL